VSRAGLQLSNEGSIETLPEHYGQLAALRPELLQAVAWQGTSTGEQLGVACLRKKLCNLGRRVASHVVWNILPIDMFS